MLVLKYVHNFELLFMSFFNHIDNYVYVLVLMMRLQRLNNYRFISIYDSSYIAMLVVIDLDRIRWRPNIDCPLKF